MTSLRRYIVSTLTVVAMALQGAIATAGPCESMTKHMQGDNDALATHAEGMKSATAAGSMEAPAPAPPRGDHSPCSTPHSEGCLSGQNCAPAAAAASGAPSTSRPAGRSRIGTSIVALMSAPPSRPVAPPPRA